MIMPDDWIYPPSIEICDSVVKDMPNEATKRFLVIQERPNPSTDYFVLPHLRDLGGVETFKRSLRSGDIELADNSKENHKQQNALHPNIPIHCISWAKSDHGQPLGPEVTAPNARTALPAVTAITAQTGGCALESAESLLDGAFVVFVRYVTHPWRKLIEQHRSKLAGLAYFFDDDIPDVKAGTGLPLKYRFKLYRHGARHFNWLLSQNATLWVSTPYLQKKYQTKHQLQQPEAKAMALDQASPPQSPIVLTPRQLPQVAALHSPKLRTQEAQPIRDGSEGLDQPTERDEDGQGEQRGQYEQCDQQNQNRSSASNRRCRVFYHATASHRAEIEWLFPVMEEVLAKAPHIGFEIVGDAKTRKLYQKLPRTTIIDPMSWLEYQKFLCEPERQKLRLIGLAPHLPTPFNAARSYTKVFDIERAGAVGILAKEGPWSQAGGNLDLNRHYLVPMQRDAWVEEVLRVSKA
jgi:hypothetical protein